jgi:hypothetical protein
MMIYRGWFIGYNPRRGCWEASQYGVTICSTHHSSLAGMIDQHIADREDWIAQRKGTAS